MNKHICQLSPEETLDTIQHLRAAANNHQRWHERLHLSLVCDEPSSNDVTSENAHTQCEFGKWYYQAVKLHDLYSSSYEFSEIEAVHKRMHDNARQLVLAKNDGTKISSWDYKNFVDSQNELLSLLGMVCDSLSQHRCRVDSLTSVSNREAIVILLEHCFTQAKRYNNIFSVAILDIDKFKAINDKYGHLVGDDVLKQVSHYLKENLRKSDMIGRFGGEEFLIIFPYTESESAYSVIEKYRQGIELLDMNINGEQLSLTVSAGISHFDPADDDMMNIVHRADIALYQAKENGRNQVVIYNQE